MSPLSCGHHSQSTSRCIADDTHRYRVCMSVGACMPLLENGMMMRVKKKKTHTETGQFKLSTVVVQKKATSTRTQRNSVKCPNTSTDSTLGSPPLHTGRIVHAYKCTYTHSTSKSQHIGIAVEEKECEWFGCIEYNIN